MDYAAKFEVGHLHSIMYLLIQESLEKTIYMIASFTFHNVSINSPTTMVCLIEIADLHSIMYLLIHIRVDRRRTSIQFTFHNVSINSRIKIFRRQYEIKFTFHNVSINSSEE